eukprot:6194591-Pleurochrysis_carterae.AAC.1
MIISYNTNNHGQRERRMRGKARGWARLRGGSDAGARQVGNVGHARARARNFGSGTRALREYTCDANAKRMTVHVSDGLGRATTIARIVRRASVKQANIRVRGQNAK